MAIIPTGSVVERRPTRLAQLAIVSQYHSDGSIESTWTSSHFGRCFDVLRGNESLGDLPEEAKKILKKSADSKRSTCDNNHFAISRKKNIPSKVELNLEGHTGRNAIYWVTAVWKNGNDRFESRIFFSVSNEGKQPWHINSRNESKQKRLSQVKWRSNEGKWMNSTISW